MVTGGSRPGDASSSTPRTTSTSPLTGPSSPAPRSSSPCSASTTWATACATPSIPARFSDTVPDHFQGDLLGGEGVLGTGQPAPTRLFSTGDVFLVPFSLMWG